MQRENGNRRMEAGDRRPKTGSRRPDSGCRRSDAGKQMADSRKQMADSGDRIPENRYRMSDSNENGWVYQPDIRVEAQLSKGEWEYKCQICGEPLQYMRTPEGMINPQNQYALSKHSEESIAISLGRRYEIPSVALRYSIVQGSRQSFYNAYSGANRIFSLNLFLDKAPTIYEDGGQVRDYVNIQDVVRANLLVLENDEANEQIFNVGGGRAYTVLEFYDIVKEVFEKDIEAKMPGVYRYGDTRHIFSDISKLRSLGWEPQFSPAKSVSDYKKYLEEQTDIQDILDYVEAQMKKMNVVRSMKF